MERYLNVQRIKRTFVWLSRIHRCQGFGVQSPSDFRFVREVVNCHRQYAEYAELDRETPNVGGLERKVCRLYFRLAASLKPAVVVNYGESSRSPSSMHMAKGCATARMSGSFDDVPQADLMRITTGDGAEQAYEQAVAKAGQRSVLVIEGIKRCGKARALWRKAVGDSRTGVTFDLYYVGIVFFDKKRYKENHIVNF